MKNRACRSLIGVSASPSPSPSPSPAAAPVTTTSERPRMIVDEDVAAAVVEVCRLSSSAARSAARARSSAAASRTLVDSNSLATSTPCAVDSLTLRAPRFKTLDTSDTLDTLLRVTLEVSPPPLVASPTAGEPRTGDATPSAVPNVAHSTLSNAPPPSDDDPPRSDSSSSIFEKAAAMDSFALLPDSAEAVLAAFTRLRRLPHIAWPFVLTGVRLSILRLLGVDAVELGAGDEGDTAVSAADTAVATSSSSQISRRLGLAGVPIGVPRSFDGLASFTGDSSCDLPPNASGNFRKLAPAVDSGFSLVAPESESNPVRSCSSLATAPKLTTSLLAEDSPGTVVTPALDAYEPWSPSSA
mmetsp:Transcript_4732/g.21171  ORF Transcript_4732/g.21171 Transcript_4732/m.21171 type:complete len:356 (+) Transcript_4732:30-1097(+)